MVYWKIELTDGRLGWQVMDNGLANALIVDQDNQPFIGSIEYKVTTYTELPEWSNA